MDIVLESEKLKALAKELAQDIKTEAALNMRPREFVKLTAETSLDLELTELQGDVQYADRKPAWGKARNRNATQPLKGGGMR